MLPPDANVDETANSQRQNGPEHPRAEPPNDPVADEAAAALAAFWPEFGRRWPWTRQRSLAPGYQLIGELAVLLLRDVPAIARSNQLLWYRRQVRDTPSIYVLFPDEFQRQARTFRAGADPRTLEAKQVVSFIYLASIDGETTVTKALLAASSLDAPFYRALLAHELVNCFCAADWDGVTLRSGVRRAQWRTGVRAQRGGALNDLLIDTLLLRFLPRWTSYTMQTLLDGTQGTYWRLALQFAERVPEAPLRAALFGPEPSVRVFEEALDAAFHLDDAAATIDRLLEEHDWAALAALHRRT
jgi:hypothetical protein